MLNFYPVHCGFLVITNNNFPVVCHVLHTMCWCTLVFISTFPENYAFLSHSCGMLLLQCLWTMSCFSIAAECTSNGVWIVMCGRVCLQCGVATIKKNLPLLSPNLCYQSMFHYFGENKFILMSLAILLVNYRYRLKGRCVHLL